MVLCDGERVALELAARLNIANVVSVLEQATRSQAPWLALQAWRFFLERAERVAAEAGDGGGGSRRGRGTAAMHEAVDRFVLVLLQCETNAGGS